MAERKPMKKKKGKSVPLPPPPPPLTENLDLLAEPWGPTEEIKISSLENLEHKDAIGPTEEIKISSLENLEHEDAIEPLGVSNLSIITSKDLKQGARRLTSITETTKASLTRASLLKLGDESDLALQHRDYFPLEKISDYLNRKLSEVGDIELQFCDELLDCFFYVLEQYFDLKKVAINVKRVNFTGCSRLTDWGVVRMVELLPNITQVNFSGCTNLTEVSMLALLELPKLKKADLSGTKCGMLANVAKKTPDTLTFRLVNCPFVSPYMEETDFTPNDFKRKGLDKGMKPSKVYKLQSIMEDGGSVSLLETLGHKRPNSFDVHYAENIKPGSTGDSHLNDVTFNIIECSEVLARPMISERCIFVLPCDADVDVNKTSDSLARRFFQIISKVDYPIVVVLGISKSGSPVATHLDIRQMLESKLFPFIKKSHAERLYKTLDLDKTPLPFKKQTLLTSLCRQDAALSCDPGSLYQGCTKYCSVADKKMDNLWVEIGKSMKLLDEIYPHYQNISDEVMEFHGYLKNLKRVMISERELIKLALEKKVIKNFAFMHYSKVLDILESLGKILVLRDEKLLSPLVVLDLLQFGNSLSESLAKFDSSGNNQELFQAGVSVDELLVIFKICSQGNGKQHLFVTLPMKPPVDLDIEDQDHYHLQLKFKTLHQLSEGAIAHILNAACVPQPATFVWKRGMVAVLPPAEVRVILSEAANKHPVICLTVVIPKCPGIDDFSGVQLLAGHTLNMYMTAVEYALQAEGVGYETTPVVENGAQIELQDDTDGVVPNHTLSMDKEGHYRCTTCGMTTETISTLWGMNSKLHPSNEVIKPDSNKWDVEGCSVKCSTGQETLFFPQMQLGINTQLAIMPLHNNASFSLLLEFNNKESYDTIKQTELSYEDLGKPTAFSKIALHLSAPKEDCMLDVSVDGKVVHQEPLQNSNLSVKMNSGDHFSGLVYAPRLLNHFFGTGEFPLQVGMKLEAHDRKTPNLMCVATIDDIQMKNGKPILLIFFDGWTRTYDYWTEPESTDLHPIGFMAKVDSSFIRGMNKHLQPPRGYKKEFDWNTYLEEEDALTVPYSFFSDEQCVGVPEFKLSSKNRKKMGDLGSVRGHCMKRRSMPHVFYTNAERLCEEPRNFTANDIFGCLLPGNLDEKLLQYDLPTKLFDWKIAKMHFFCPKNGTVHLSENPPLNDFNYMDVGIKSLMRSIVHAIQCILKSEYIVPTKLSWISGIDNWGLEKFNNTMKKCLMDFLCYYLLYEDEPDNPSAMKLLWDRYCDTQLSVSGGEAGKAGYQEQALCQAHRHATSTDMSLTAVPMSFQHHMHLIRNLNLARNNITELPNDFFPNFPILSQLTLSENELSILPESIDACIKLRTLDISFNKIAELPKSFATLNLESLNITSNPFTAFPQHVIHCKTLITLLANNLIIKELPSNIGDMSQLQVLTLAESLVTSLPESFSQLTNLNVLDISGLHWVDREDTSTAILSHDAFEELLEKSLPASSMSKEERDKLFPVSKGTMNYKEIQLLNVELYKKFPRLGRDSTSDDQNYGGVPCQIFDLTNLKRLTLRYCGITKITEHVQKLKNLRHLNVSHCPQLESIGGEISQLPMESLTLRGCPTIKTPPKEIIARGFTTTLAYLKRLSAGSVECKRTKLMMVGLGGAGKTSLVKALTSGYYQSSGTHGENITDGIDITNWKVQADDQEITFSVWDFAGQTVYYNTHQFFLSNRAVYFLLWNIRLGYEHAGLDFWLASIACHAPKAPIFVIGTHADQVEKFYLPEADLKQRYSQIVGFHNISSYQGTGVYELSQDLIRVALEQKYMGERIPEAWLNLEKHLITKRKDKAIIPWTDLVNIASESAIVDKEEVNQSVAFLHDLGSLQHFENDFLKSIVVINPQWIVDVMACVVSVHDSPIVDGRLKHEDVKSIWRDYDAELHEWMLRLTEEFDLTFPIKNEEANLVPCLMTEEEPEYDWPEANEKLGIRENKMLYHFEYLPAGLFNRAQVRLYQFSDSSVIWKRGSLLRKNEHIAIMQQLRDFKVLIRVQGARPENILYLVHEVFETMIQESFHGVTYEYSIPCSNCLNIGSTDPSMFSQKQIMRATELKAPFLQCSQYFHTLTLTELHSLMLPSSGADFDVHLAKSLRELNDLKDDLTTDVFMYYCSEDLPPYGKEDQYVHPQRVCDDMEQLGLRVWFPVDPNLVDIRQEAVTIMEAKVIMLCISDNFVKDPKCCEIFNYATKTVQKKIQLVVLTSSMSWTKSKIGAQVSTEVYVKMDNPQRYQTKVVELFEALKGKMSGKETKRDFPPCFVSYCWANSRDAVSKGTRAPESALGWADPREFKGVLEKAGIRCWMDIERVGQRGRGLFEDIADALKHAKVLVACLSDEYAKSKNSQMEIRFASVSLKIPIIIAVVGTGYQWQSSEVGMLSLGCPMVNLQLESASSMSRLMELVRNHLPDPSEEEEAKRKAEKANSNVAFKELIELAQWKFLRQITSYAESMAIGSFPRLFAADFMTEEDVANLNDVLRKFSPELVDGQPGNMDDPGVALQDRDVGGEHKEELMKMLERLGAFNKLEGSLCMRILCEHEEGWHYESCGIPLKLMTDDDEMEFLKNVAPYAARIMAILRHTPLNMPILKTEEGEKICMQLEEIVIDSGEFKKEYQMLRKCVMAADVLRVMGGLARCYLPNGKTMWLCARHQKGDRVTVLSSEASSAVHVTPDADVLMAQEIAKQAASRPMSAGGLRKAVRGKLIGAQAAIVAAKKYKGAKEKNLTAAAQTAAAAGKPNSDGRKSSRACIVM